MEKKKTKSVQNLPQQKKDPKSPYIPQTQPLTLPMLHHDVYLSNQEKCCLVNGEESLQTPVRTLLSNSRDKSDFKGKYRNSKKFGLNCLYYNADCLLNKLFELEAIVYLDDPDVILITESLPKNLSIFANTEILNKWIPGFCK